MEEILFNTEFSASNYYVDGKKFENLNNSDYFEQQIEKLKNIQTNRTIRLLKDPKLREQIEKNTLEQFLKINKVVLSEDYDKFKPKIDKNIKRIELVQGFLTFYSIYFMINLYESKKTIFDKTADLINKTPRKLAIFNYKLHLIVFTSLFTALFFLFSKSKRINNEFRQKLREKYFQEGFDLSNVRIHS